MTTRIDGQTAEEWAEELFRYQYCCECGKDKEDHQIVVGPTGHWFAFCTTEIEED